MTFLEEVKKEKTWHKKCLGILILHTSEIIKHENKRGSKWKIEDTAKLLEISVGYVSESIKLAKAIPKFRGELEKLTREGALKKLKENGRDD